MVDAILNFFRQLLMGIKDMIWQYDQQLQATKTPKERWIRWLIIVALTLGFIGFVLWQLGGIVLSILNSASSGGTGFVEKL